VQHNTVSDDTVLGFEITEYLCTAVFTVELCARLYVHRFGFFTNLQERWWNMFDLFLVGLCLIDAALSLGVGTQGGVEGLAGKVGRTIRLLRIMRIIRVVKKMTQLRVMLNMIISSLQSLFWVMIIMVGVIYIVAVVLTQGATDYLKGPNAPRATEEYEQVRSMYGSLFSTMYTLFQCMSGGISWGLASEALRSPGWLFEAIVMCYVFFMIFAVHNIVNGVFVDGAIELSKRDRTALMQKYLEDHADKERHAIELMTLMDKDGDQLITFDEFMESLQEQEVRDYISALEVDVTDAKVFFQMLDRDGSGSVDILEFTSGMRKFRGEAKSVDIHMMLHQNKQLFKLVTCLVGSLWPEMEEDEDDTLAEE
jgi:voltage-gated sodium channel